MTGQEERWVSELARDVVARAAPEELPMFTAMRETYFRDPEKALAQQGSEEQALGFGMAAAAQLLTPLVLKVVSEVVRFVAEQFTQQMKEEGKSTLRPRFKRFFRWLKGVFGLAETEAPLSPPRLTQAQLQQVYDLALQKALQAALSKEKARLLADSLVGRLALA